jgi:hypothetical protein
MFAASSIGQGFKFCHHCWGKKIEFEMRHEWNFASSNQKTTDWCYDTQHNDIQHNDTLLKHSGIMLAASSIGQGVLFYHHCWHWWKKMEKIELEMKTQMKNCLL